MAKPAQETPEPIEETPVQPAATPVATPVATADATTESLLALRRRVPVEPHTLPDGRRVWIHGLTDAEVQQWFADCGRNDTGHINDTFGDAKLLVRTVCDAAGRRLFTDDHLPQLIELPNVVKAPMVRKAMVLSAIGGSADEAILKNYSEMLTSGSSSA